MYKKKEEQRLTKWSSLDCDDVDNVISIKPQPEGNPEEHVRQINNINGLSDKGANSGIRNSNTTTKGIGSLELLWKAFKVLSKALTANPGDDDYHTPAQFQSLAIQWGKDFRRVTLTQEAQE
ncbi:hypothetical protein QZH41_020678 [Actinostola sp. cb2023]|nr:hypothetical protein QZH41_020678 [Actinostola sp. cb2023]